MFLDMFLTDSSEMDTLSTKAGFFQTDEATVHAIDINEVIIGKCIADKFYMEASSDTDISSWDGTFPSEWAWETVMSADFSGNLAAGSVDFSVDVVSAIRLKRRKNGTNKWKTLFVKDVDSVDDFQFDYYDRLAAGDTTYEYAFVPIISGEEGPFIATPIKSEFRDYYILDKDQMHHVIMDAVNTPTYNIEGAAQTTIARKYPFVIRNGYVGYYSGTFEATFMTLVCGDTDGWDVTGGPAYRREVDKFLANENVKIIKDWLGNIYMASIYEPISQNVSDWVYTPVHTINWVECGDADDVGDLYDNGFIDTDIDRE